LAVFVPLLKFVPTVHAEQMPLALTVHVVNPYPSPQLLMVTAPHPSALLLAENVEPALQALHLPFRDVVAAVKP